MNPGPSTNRETLIALRARRDGYRMAQRIAAPPMESPQPSREPREPGWQLRRWLAKERRERERSLLLRINRFRAMCYLALAMIGLAGLFTLLHLEGAF